MCVYFTFHISYLGLGHVEEVVRPLETYDILLPFVAHFICVYFTFHISYLGRGLVEEVVRPLETYDFLLPFVAHFICVFFYISYLICRARACRESRTFP